MLEKNTIRVQQAQPKKKPNKAKSLIWKLFKGVVFVLNLVFKILRFLEGDDS